MHTLYQYLPQNLPTPLHALSSTTTDTQINRLAQEAENRSLWFAALLLLSYPSTSTYPDTLFQHPATLFLLDILSLLYWVGCIGETATAKTSTIWIRVNFSLLLCTTTPTDLPNLISLPWGMVIVGEQWAGER